MPIIASHIIGNPSWLAEFLTVRDKSCKGLRQTSVGELVIMVRIEIHIMSMAYYSKYSNCSISLAFIKTCFSVKWMSWLICKCRWYDFCSTAFWRLILSNVWQHHRLYWPTANIGSAQPAILFSFSLVYCLCSFVNGFIRRIGGRIFAPVISIFAPHPWSFASAAACSVIDIWCLLLLGWW